MRLTLADDFEQVTYGRVTLLNNTWGVYTWGHTDWVNGVDYAQSITYDPATPLRDVRMQWDYSARPDGNVLGYPEVFIGYKPWNEGSTFMVDQVSDLRELTLTTDIDIGGDTTGFNVAYDLWFTDTPAGGPDSITAELMVWLHKGGFTPAGTPIGRYVGPDVSATIWYEAAIASGPDKRPSYIALVVDGGQLDGTVDMAAMLRYLDRRGLIAGDDYLTGVELGPELMRGAGSMTINSLNYTHSKYVITAGADRLTGTAGDDMIDARAGADTIQGGRGADRLAGGDGADVVLGGAGNDWIRGGAGADKLYGGSGLDHVLGGAGADRFVWTDLQSGDVIRDFSHAAGDRIDLRGIDANSARTGNQAFDFIGTAGFSGQRGELRTVTAGNGTRIAGDVDGDGRADLVMMLQDGVRLQAGDFQL
jgi:Glycosyl hydrolase family 12/RTX calcium-binding nonapeptide repeat (4 copies)